MHHLKVRNEIAKIESQKNEFCSSLNGSTGATMLLGSTGGGKTTLIEFLLNKELIIGVNHGNPYLDSNSSNIDNGPNSKTREITLYSTSDNQLYIDTPGFSDTYGEYNEINNYFAIESILKCENIKGFKIGLVLSKSILFYEANRNKDFINFIKSIKNFIPKIGATQWMNEAFIVITKTEKRTTTGDAIKALASAINENSLDSNEREFFENIINNKKIALFPLPEEPYDIGATFQNEEASENIMQLIKQSSYIELEKEDFKKFDLSLALDGEVLTDVNRAKMEIANQARVLMSAIRDYQQKITTALPTNSFNIASYRLKKKGLENYLANDKNPCDSSERSFYINAMHDFKGNKKLIDSFCELDYSIKFMQKLESFNNGLIDVNDTKKELHNTIHPLISAYNWKICTLNSYKALFYSFKKDDHSNKKSIDELLERNHDVIDLFNFEMDKKAALSQLLNRCSTSEEEVRVLSDLASLIENNAMNKLAKFISNGEQLQYHPCKITGNVPRISQISFDNDELASCTEIAIYGRYGIKIDKSIETELRGKNLVMIAPTIKVIGDQKIVLSGVEGKNHSILEANEEKDGLAGNAGESSGSFLGYSYNKIGDLLRIYAEGGRGGDGQNGGKGEDKKKGSPDDGYTLQSSSSDLVYSKKFLHDKPEGVTYNWYKVTRFSDQGEPGSKGGNGRTGGEGGKGGAAGEVNLKILDHAGFEKYEYIANDGLNGQNGNPGKGGEGGESGDAIQGIWHYTECTSIFFFCGLWSPQGYWEQGHEPTLQISQKTIASNGESGGLVPFHKSSSPIEKSTISQEEHKAQYVDFILDESSDAFSFYEVNTLASCVMVDNDYNCF